MSGDTIYEYLKDNNLLEGCLGLADALAIQKKGIEFFREHFGGKVIYFWKSAVQDRDGNLRVPCLIEDDDGVVVFWFRIDFDWDSDEPALRKDLIKIMNSQLIKLITKARRSAN